MTARSGWHGPYWRGAARQDRERKRVQAEGRNRRTPPERRRRNRQETPLPPRCYDCTTTQNIVVKVLDPAGFEHWFCGPCWHEEQQLGEAVAAMLRRGYETLAAMP